MLRSLATTFVAFAALALVGCDEEVIRHYRVPKEPVRTEEHPHPGPTTHAPQAALRTLAAIVPHGERVWFFKLSGAAEEIAPLADAFDRFLASLRFDASPEHEIAWTLPDGWKETPGAGMRFATISAGATPNAPEMTVVPLGSEAGAPLPNINRWRDQLGLGPIAEADLGRVTRKIEVAGAVGLRVDLSTPEGGVARPVTDRPTEGAPEFTAPAGWQANADPGMGIAAYTIADAGRKAEVSVVPLPGPAGGLLQNVNRWRKQLGLDAVAEDGLAGFVRTVPLGGADAQLVDLTAPESAGAARERILGVIQIRGGQTWFFKMKGAAALVEQQKPAFEEFIRSVHFGGADGDKDKR